MADIGVKIGMKGIAASSMIATTIAITAITAITASTAAIGSRDTELRGAPGLIFGAPFWCQSARILVDSRSCSR
jgi:hypothetical protein